MSGRVYPRGASRRHHSAGERGTTLPEVMIAMFVLTVGALALIRLTVTGAEGVAVADRITYATILATDKLDELERLQSTDASLTAGEHQDPSGKNLGPTGQPYGRDGSPTGDLGTDDGWFARTWTVTDLKVDDTALANDFKQIEVRVRWYDGAAKRERMVTVVGGMVLE